MLHILLLILKIAGFTLLGIIGLLLLILLLVLCVPVRYRGGVNKDDKLSASARVSWLLHLLHINVEYADELTVSVKVLGMQVYPKQEKPTKSGIINNKTGKKKKEGPESEAASAGNGAESDSAENDIKETESVDTDIIETDITVTDSVETDIKETDSADTGSGENDNTAFKAETACPDENLTIQAETEPDDNIEPEQKSRKQKSKKRKERRKKNSPGDESDVNPKDSSNSESADGIQSEDAVFTEKLIRAVEAVIDGIDAKKDNIEKKLEEISAKIEKIRSIVDDEKVRHAVRVAFRQLGRLLKHLLPRNIKGNAEFGFENPAITGYVLALLGSLYGTLTHNFNVCPDFENKVFRADCKLRGHIRIITLLLIALKVLLTKDCRYTYKLIKSEVSGKEDEDSPEDDLKEDNKEDDYGGEF